MKRERERDETTQNVNTDIAGECVGMGERVTYDIAQLGGAQEALHARQLGLLLVVGHPSTLLNQNTRTHAEVERLARQSLFV